MSRQGRVRDGVKSAQPMCPGTDDPPEPIESWLRRWAHCPDRAVEPGDILGEPQRIGHFLLERRLGRGGMASVWQATHEVTGRRVAIKILRAGSKVSGVARQRLLREARATEAVRHPNVVAVHDVLETGNGAPALVMDLLIGESLRQRLHRRRRLTLRETAVVMGPAAAP